MTLSLNNFVISRQDGDDLKQDVWCKSHAPRLSAHCIDAEALAIKNAVSSQRLQKAQCRVNDTAGWQYDPKALEFEMAKVLQDRNRTRRPSEHDRPADASVCDRLSFRGMPMLINNHVAIPSKFILRSTFLGTYCNRFANEK